MIKGPKLPYWDPFSFNLKNLGKRVKYVFHNSIKMRIHISCYDILKRIHESFNIFITQWLILRKYFFFIVWILAKSYIWSKAIFLYEFKYVVKITYSYTILLYMYIHVQKKSQVHNQMQSFFFTFWISLYQLLKKY